MSGGSLNYISGPLDEAAQTIKAFGRSPLHLAFALHVEQVAHALHDLEWVLSGDRKAGDEIAAIEACLQPGAEFSLIQEEARRLYADLGEVLLRHEAKQRASAIASPTGEQF